jgi:hypothetical protein
MKPLRSARTAYVTPGAASVSLLYYSSILKFRDHQPIYI